MKCNNCEERINILLKLKCPTSTCDKYFCSSSCLNIHISKSHISNPHTLERKSIKSPFVRQGEFLKEYKNDKIYDFDSFKILKLGEDLHIIGRGAYGDVFLAKNRLDGKYYAIKKMNKFKISENGISKEMVIREIQIHRRLVHENIVKLFSHYEDNTDYYLVMEYINKNTLFHIIKLNEGGLNEKKAFKYFIQVVSAVNFLHENNLIHRDIKPENLLLDDKDKVKLCDFGWCVDLKFGNRVTFCGTFEYMAPELIKELPYNFGVDIWSLGVLLYELLHGYSPFKDIYGESNYTGIFKNILKNNLTIRNDISEHSKDLIKRLLTPENNKRIKISEIYHHPWVKFYENEYYEEYKKYTIKNKNIKSNSDLYNIPISYSIRTKTEGSDAINFNDTIRNESLSNFNLLDDTSDYFSVDRKESKRKSSEIKPEIKKKSISPKNINVVNDNLFDKVLNQISSKNKNNRKVSRTSVQSNKLTQSSVSSINSNQNLKVDKISIEIKSNKEKSLDKTKGVELFEFDSFSELLKNDNTENIIENDSRLEDSNYYDINKQLKDEFDHLKDFPISDKLIFGESNMREKPRCSSLNKKSIDYVYTLGNVNKNESDYNTNFSTETPERETYMKFIQNTGFKSNALLALERLEDNKNKVLPSLEPVKKKDKSIWDSFTSIFSPFKCDNK